MKRLAAWIIQFRLPLLLGIILLTVFFAYQLSKVKIDSDILNYLPQDDPVVVLFREIGDKFGGTRSLWSPWKPTMYSIIKR